MIDKKDFVEKIIEKLDECMDDMDDYNDDNMFEDALYNAEQLRQSLVEISKSL